MTAQNNIDVFYGRVTRSSAQVYVRVGSLKGGEAWSISGKVRGPNARGTRTLPTTVSLRDMGQGDTLLASCAIPDPACWSWQLPCTYDVTIELRHDGDLRHTINRSLGIRFFGASGDDLRWEGKRWVFRGVASQEIDCEQVEDLSDNVGAIVTRDPADELLEQTSLLGVLIAAEVTGDDLTNELRRLGSWPSAAMAILPNYTPISQEIRAAAGNMLLAVRVNPDTSQPPAEWAEVVFCDAEDINAFKSATCNLEVPVIAERQLSGDYTLLEGRRECDRLQRDLVVLRDFAGYVVRVGNSAE